MSKERRDFRYARLASNFTEECTYPWIPVKADNANCLQILLWSADKEAIKQTGPGSYLATPPEPKKEGHWVGYYVEIGFKGMNEHKALFRNQFRVSTPGYTNPNTLPFAPCNSHEGDRPCTNQ